MYNIHVRENGILKIIDGVIMSFFIVLDDVNLEDAERSKIPPYLGENNVREFEFDYNTSSDNFSVALAKYILECEVKSKVINNLNENFGSTIECGFSPVTVLLNDDTDVVITIDEFKDIVFGGRIEV